MCGLTWLVTQRFQTGKRYVTRCATVRNRRGNMYGKTAYNY